MISEHPSDPSQGTNQVPESDLTGGGPDHGDGADGSRGPWTIVVVIACVLVVAWGVAAFLLFSAEPRVLPQRETSRQGLACPLLRQAAEASERGDRATLEQNIAQASKIAEGTLQNSGEVFGAPERIALELTTTPKTRVPELLDQAEEKCSSLGRWPASD